MGRNVWQSEQSLTMIQAISAIAHDKYSIKEVVELYETNTKVKVIE